MSSWWLELLVGALSPSDRETVLGDLAEAGETGSRALLSVADLIIRRHLSLWRDWRPWIAAFGVAMPASFLLMGLSVSIAQAVLPAAGRHASSGLTGLLGHIGLLAAWSATAGFAAGTMSRRTAWVSVTFSLLPCVFCFTRFRTDGLSPLSLLLFLPPAIAGLCFGLRTSRIHFGAALVVAFATTVLALPNWNHPGAWLPNSVLSWPAWYLAVIAWRGKTQIED